MSTHIGIEIDGGGAKGFIPLMALLRLEHVFHRRVCDLVDFCIGTSVGAIEAAVLATGKLCASDLRDMMRTVVPRIFTRQWLPPIPFYSRRAFRRAWDEYIGSVHLGDVRVPLLVTSVDLCTGEPQYWSSDNAEHAELPLRDVVEYSFAAPVYFGGIADPKHGAVWLDGGTGIDNCPLLRCMLEMVQRGWIGHKRRSHILSLGCGYNYETTSYHRATRWLGSNLRQARLYWSHDDGGLARRQSISDRVAFAMGLDPALPQFSFDRLDTGIPRKLDIMDGKQYIEQYEAIGENLARALILAPFQTRLAERQQQTTSQLSALQSAAGKRT